MALHRTRPWQHEAVRPYRLRGWRRWLMWWLFGPLLGVSLPLLAQDVPGERTAGAALCAISLVALLSWHLLWRRTVLELSSRGPRVRQLGYVLQAAWDDVATLHTAPQREGFVLHRAMDSPGARRLAAFGHAVDADVDRWIRERRFIPIDAFASHLAHGTLHADLQALAPAVLASAPASAPR